MAYDKRISELQDQLRSAAPDAEDPAVRTLTDCIKTYAGLRETAFRDLIDLINNATIGASGLQDHWQSRAQHAREDLNRLFGDSVKDVMLAAPLQAFWAATVQFESNFFTTLSTVQTPQFVENLLTHQGQLALLIEKLKSIWNDLLSSDKDLENAQMNSVKDLDQLMQSLTNEIEQQYRAIVPETIEQVRNGFKELSDSVKKELEDRFGVKVVAGAKMGATLVFELLKKKLNVPSIPSPAKAPVDAQQKKVETFIERLAYFSRAYRDLCATYRGLMSTEKGGVLTMFKATREQVTEYERNNNLVTAQIMRDEAQRFLSEWADHTVAEQRDDGAEFNQKIFDVIGKNWKVTEEMAKQFEERFSGVFYAPLTKDTIETLTESYMFRQAIDSVNGRGVSAKIDETRKLLAASVDVTAEQAVQPLESMSTDWSSELKEAASLSKEEFRTYVRDRLKSQIDLALNSLGELRFLIDPPKVVADFTREELDAMLRN